VRDPPPVLAKVTRGGSGLQNGARCGHVSRRLAAERRCSRGRGVATVERMTIQRMEHVGIVVNDLAAATAFFVGLGLKPQGEAPVEGGWVDRVVGLEDGVWAEIAMVETPDGHGRLELTKFHARRAGAATGTRRRTPRASAISHSQSTISTPSSLACEPAAQSSLARWCATETVIGSATFAALAGPPATGGTRWMIQLPRPASGLFGVRGTYIFRPVAPRPLSSRSNPKRY
jgi:Glyoxalase/Bleomycin resistance protein/Dioxygenase superfamily